MTTVATGRSKDAEKGRQILSAAGALFMSEGFEAASMEKVAKAAGVSKQTVYSHYGSKEALFSAAIEAKCEEFQVGYSEADLERPVRAVLREFVGRFSDLLISAEGVGIYRVCIADAGRSGVAELFWQAGPRQIMERLMAYLQAQVRRGELDINNAHFAADQLLFMVKSDAHMRGLLSLPVAESLDELPAYLDSCVEVFLRAYGRQD